MEHPFEPNYTITNDLSNGFLGRTLLLKHNESSALFVCKMISKEFLGNQDMVKAFIEKIKHLQDLNLMFIVNYTEILETESTIYLIRPYFQSQTLSNFLQSPIKQHDVNIVALWKTIARSIMILHNNNISSLPIKPSNILIFNEKFISLTDMYEIKSNIRWSLETVDRKHLLFIPPEFFTDSAKLGPRSDTWSLGVLFAFMKGATLPWNCSNVFTMVKKITNGEIPTNLPEDCAPMVERMLQVSPENRPQIQDLIYDENLRTPKRRRQSEPLKSASTFDIPRHQAPSLPVMLSLSKFRTSPQLTAQTSESTILIRRRFYTKALPDSKNKPPIPRPVLKKPIRAVTSDL